MKSKKAYEAACQKARKLAREKNLIYIVYWLEEYNTYRVIPKENLMCYDNGTPFEEILFLVEP